MSTYAIVLSGGVGSRMGLGTPKQYMQVAGLPVLMYSIRKFAQSPLIDGIVIVLAEEWQSFIRPWLEADGTEVMFAPSGNSREHSVLNGLERLRGVAAENDVILIHDSARPLFNPSLIGELTSLMDSFQAALPVIPSSDASYRSTDGKTMSEVLRREELFLGQSPECIRYGNALAIHEGMDDAALSALKGISELAFRKGLNVGFASGDFANFKITTQEDLVRFETMICK